MQPNEQTPSQLPPTPPDPVTPPAQPVGRTVIQPLSSEESIRQAAASSVAPVQPPEPATPPQPAYTAPQPYQPPTPNPAPAPIAEQWQTRQEYSTAQTAVEAPKTGSDIPRKAAIALGISVFVFILAVSTPLGDIGAFGGDGGGRAMTARPIAGIAAIVTLISYFVMVIAGIATSQATGKTLSIIGLIIGSLLVANPIGLIMLFMIIGCNFTACQGT